MEPTTARPATTARRSRRAPDRKATVVVVDHEITPSQARNLERATGAEVIDRTGVIVEIFHRHARSREARLEVEIARLNYVAPRLREGGGGDRQRGGIGGKGAGESALELDRRKIRDRIAELREELAAIQKEQGVRRAHRRDARRVALVGYTNAGKSSLMRALTGSEVLVADKLFATLDTTVRALHPETKPRILVSDTVGFIKKLPHDLVASFRSTLDEALEASFLLYVADASDPTFRGQLEVTRTVLGEIGADAVPSRLLLNKVDRLDAAARGALAAEYPEAILLSAKEPADVAALRQTIVAFFEASMVEGELVGAVRQAEPGRRDLRGGPRARGGIRRGRPPAQGVGSPGGAGALGEPAAAVTAGASPGPAGGAGGAALAATSFASAARRSSTTRPARMTARRPSERVAGRPGRA